MEKYFEEWNGKKFPVRVVSVDAEYFGYSPIKVADIDLWFAIEEDYNNGNTDADIIDNSIYCYFNSGVIASDPTDKEIIEYLIQHEC